MTLEDRLSEALTRHGPDSPYARCHSARAHALREAVRRTTTRLSHGARQHP